MKYCGIDLHSNNSVVVVSDEEDRIPTFAFLRSSRPLATIDPDTAEPKQLKGWMRPTPASGDFLAH